MYRPLSVLPALLITQSIALAQPDPTPVCTVPCTVGDCVIEVTVEGGTPAACDEARSICSDNLGGIPSETSRVYFRGAVCGHPRSPCCKPCHRVTRPCCPCGLPRVEPDFLRLKVDCIDANGNSLPYGCGLTCNQAQQDCWNRGGTVVGACTWIYGPCPVKAPVACCPQPAKKRCRLFGRVFGRRR
jgi:hypothetical protein